ncbi:helix-turn-helix domain-containing protein [Actinomadura parmotrematis]|uniref:Helix-turn-helix domain-containing protein n=1 Tax=Actinomadura parmotrematis TaxID=2864039 RepID=A0ABS7FVF4_9ACTN|nr:helix-turn-helix transcriptional regulator [Actinomadura parmotrematis]MBW8483945.1 helix-turn-helix domain-containing protein [Actinomadura parmotrematis]
MVQPHNPTVRGRRLARELRDLRERAALSHEEAARRLGWSRQKIMRIEKAITKANPHDLNAILELYGVTSPKREALVQLSRDAWKRGWWTAYRDIYAGTYLSLEDEAARFREWQPQAVPGLLQTPDYAREVIKSFTTDEAHIERRLAARVTRRSLLSRDPAPRFHAVLDEAILFRLVGGREVMRTQVESLLADGRRPNVALQILPFAVGRHPGLDGGFTILSFEEGVDPDIAYLETTAGDLYIEAEDDVDRCRVRFKDLSALALSPDETRRRLERGLREVAGNG